MLMEVYTRTELNKVLSDLLSTETPTICKIGFSEELDTDCVEIYQHDKLIRTEKLENFLDILSVHIESRIIKYDVFEIGDNAEHFVFQVDAFYSLKAA